MSFHSTISQRRLDTIRDAKMPTQEEIALAAEKFPNSPFSAAQYAHRLASERMALKRANG